MDDKVKCTWHNEVLPYLIFKGINTPCLSKEMDDITEIRLRAGRPVVFENFRSEWFLLKDGRITKNDFGDISEYYLVCAEEIEKILNNIAKNSIYAFQDCISNGFITLRGGHRVGITGKVVLEGNEISKITDFSGLNFRICREIKGCAKKIMPYIWDGYKVLNTLIVSPPGCGKTTILRDIARTLSNGDKNEKIKGIKIGIVDERSEIAGVIKGVPQLDVGLRSDVLDLCPKESGINIFLRSMSPAVIITDEIGTEEDFTAITKSVNSGVKIIATYHGNARFGDKVRKNLQSFLENRVFDRVVNISNENGPGTLEEVYDVKAQNIIYKRCSDD